MCGQEQAPGRKQLWQLRWRRAHPGEREGTGACGRAMVLPVEAGPWRGCEESIFGDPQGRVRSGLRYICGTGCKIKGVPLRFRAPSPSSPHGKSPALPSSGPEIACREVCHVKAGSVQPFPHRPARSVFPAQLHWGWRRVQACTWSLSSLPWPQGTARATWPLQREHANKQDEPVLGWGVGGRRRREGGHFVSWDYIILGLGRTRGFSK